MNSLLVSSIRFFFVGMSLSFLSLAASAFFHASRSGAGRGGADARHERRAQQGQRGVPGEAQEMRRGDGGGVGCGVALRVFNAGLGCGWVGVALFATLDC